MRVSGWMALCLLVLSVSACTHAKPKPLVPLELSYGTKADAIALNTRVRRGIAGGRRCSWSEE